MEALWLSFYLYLQPHHVMSGTMTTVFVRLFCFLVDIKLYIPNNISLSVMLNSLSYSFTYTMYMLSY